MFIETVIWTLKKELKNYLNFIKKFKKTKKLLGIIETLFKYLNLNVLACRPF